MKGAEYVGTEKYWIENVRSKKPLPLRCLKCNSKKIIDGTALEHAIRGRLGCPCRRGTRNYEFYQTQLREKAEAEIGVSGRASCETQCETRWRSDGGKLVVEVSRCEYLLTPTLHRYKVPTREKSDHDYEHSQCSTGQSRLPVSRLRASCGSMG